MKYMIFLISAVVFMGCEPELQQEAAQTQTDDQLDLSLSSLSDETLGEETDIVDEGDEVPSEVESDTRSFRQGKRHKRFRHHVRKMTRRKLVALTGEEDDAFSDRVTIARQAAVACHSDIKAYILEEFDINGDGELDESEKEDLKAARQVRKETLKNLYDSNSDGKISRDEAIAMAQGLSDLRIGSLLSKFDSNDDGRISDEEVNSDDLPECQIPELN